MFDFAETQRHKRAFSSQSVFSPNASQGSNSLDTLNHQTWNALLYLLFSFIIAALLGFMHLKRPMDEYKPDDEFRERTDNGAFVYRSTSYSRSKHLLYRKLSSRGMFWVIYHVSYHKSLCVTGWWRQSGNHVWEQLVLMCRSLIMSRRIWELLAPWKTSTSFSAIHLTERGS